MTETTSVTVAVGKFEDLMARGLRGLIEDDPALELIAQDIPPERLPTLLRVHQPRVAIINSGSLRSSVEVRELSSENPATHLVVLANNPSNTESAQLLAFGASACIPKSTQARDVLTAIYLASRGMQLIPRDAEGVRPTGCELLTLRESDVLAQLQRRRSNAQIAAELHIGIETVRTHARNIYRKLGVQSQRDLLTAPARVPATATFASRQRSAVHSRRRPLARV